MNIVLLLPQGITGLSATVLPHQQLFGSLMPLIMSYGKQNYKKLENKNAMQVSWKGGKEKNPTKTSYLGHV